MFYSLYIFLSIGLTYAALAGTIIDPLIGGLACHTASQLKILRFRLENLTIHDQYNEIVQFELIYSKIKKCIIHHNAILDFTRMYEECFSLSVFSQFVASVFVICFCCLQLREIPLLSLNGISSIIYLIIILIQVYFYCYYGTLIFEENHHLANAIYMSNWYEYDIKSKKALIILMEKSTKPLIINAGKIFNLSLEMFTLSFSINLRVMNACCLYPPMQHNSLYKITAYLMHVCFVMLVPTLGILHLLLEDNLDMERVNYNAGFLAQATCFITKFLPFVKDGHRIRKCIDHLESSFFVKEYEKCFSLVVFSQFAGSVFVICFCCLQLSEIRSLSFYFFQLIIYFSVILAEIYFYCYYGSTLLEESNTVADAIYMGKWYDYDAKCKKALILLMERSKVPITVTAGKIIELSLPTFTTVLKRSYSLLAVLKNYQ
ncbi:7tm 6 domain containing protein [Asbolus verrucosus]|uniref:Odorant receptor n=1 Tax=Asbolus verrucosus TaxID=1661398 RepID=A0A482VFM7_ASBVE|nr:7tm 6 domain containing protein [Asbolus verrucosus]